MQCQNILILLTKKIKKRKNANVNDDGLLVRRLIDGSTRFSLS